MKRFVIDILYIVQVTPWRCLSIILNYTYPVCGEIKKKLVISSSASKYVVYDMTLFTSEHKIWELDTTSYM